MSHMS